MKMHFIHCVIPLCVCVEWQQNFGMQIHFIGFCLFAYFVPFVIVFVCLDVVNVIHCSIALLIGFFCWVIVMQHTYLDACVFFLSLREPREFVETVESFLVKANAPCTPYRTNDNGFIATL